MEEAEPVKVFVRIRPEALKDEPIPSGSSGNTGDLASISSKCLHVIDEKTIRLVPPEGTGARKTVAAVDDKIFSFDQVFHPHSSQEDVYNDASTLVKATVRGYNTTIFAYGSTGSGKSHTMMGNQASPGIIPRAISEIFSIIESATSRENDVFFYVRLSYVELYNNNFRNLLDSVHPSSSTKDSNTSMSEHSVDLEGMSSSSSDFSRLGRRGSIEVRESPSEGVFLAGPNLRLPVTSAQDAFQLISMGNKQRAVSSTLCNDMSSRYCACMYVPISNNDSI